MHNSYFSLKYNEKCCNRALPFLPSCLSLFPIWFSLLPGPSLTPAMLKINKNGVTFETTLSCPQSRVLDVFIDLICREDFTWYNVAVWSNFVARFLTIKLNPQSLATMNYKQQKHHLANVNKNTWEAYSTLRIHMKLEQDLPTSFQRLCFFKKYDLILLKAPFHSLQWRRHPKTVEKILQNDIYICMWS